jgi:cell division protein FtsW
MVSGRIDRTILLLTIGLSTIGIVMVYSSTSVSPETGTQSFYFLKRHLLTFFIGLVFLGVFINLDLSVIKKMAIPGLFFSFILLLLVFTNLGISAGGARRWLRLWPTAFQPSELAKLCMVLFLSWYMSRREYDPMNFWHMIIPVGVMGAFQLVFIKQPDFGAFMSLGALTFSMIYLSGTRLRYITIFGVALVPVIFYLIKEPYRWKRIISFLDPWKDPTGSGFQLIQSLIAFGSGGFTGIGLGESKQKLLYLPAIHNDFIFSLIGEELGFIGASVVVLLFLWFFLRGMAVARRTSDPFAYYLASGVSLMIAIQAVVNFCVSTGLAPTKGLPLPFISYGGSSLVVNMIATGILLNISKNSEYLLKPELRKKDILMEKKKAFIKVRLRSKMSCGAR